MGNTRVITVDSCHSLWVFDTELHTFFRILKGLEHGTEAARTQSRSYVGLYFDPGSDSFVVMLNEAGTRFLRSWRHLGPACTQCGASVTEELSLDDIARID
jgi:hypothetical protein